MDDTEIIDLYFQRQEDALRLTQEKYANLCHSVAVKIVGSRETAEECVNDAFLTAWTRIPPEKPVHFGAYLCKITRNLALKQLESFRAAKRNGVTLSIDEVEPMLPDDGSERQIQQAELTELLEAFLRQEKPVARNVFLRRYWFFDSVQDIAKRYGFSQSKVKSMLFHSRNRLREFLKQEGIVV